MIANKMKFKFEWKYELKIKGFEFFMLIRRNFQQNHKLLNFSFPYSIIELNAKQNWFSRQLNFNLIEFELNLPHRPKKVFLFCCVSAAIGSKNRYYCWCANSLFIHRTFDNVQCGRNVKAAGGRWARNAPIVNVLLFG